jgi:hypothetical protein
MNDSSSATGAGRGLQLQTKTMKQPEPNKLTSIAPVRCSAVVRPVGVVKPIGPSSDDFDAWLKTREDVALRFEIGNMRASRHTGYEIWRSAWMACEREHGIRSNTQRSEPSK